MIKIMIIIIIIFLASIISICAFDKLKALNQRQFDNIVTHRIGIVVPQSSSDSQKPSMHHDDNNDDGDDEYDDDDYDEYDDNDDNKPKV